MFLMASLQSSNPTAGPRPLCDDTLRYMLAKFDSIRIPHITYRMWEKFCTDGLFLVCYESPESYAYKYRA